MAAIEAKYKKLAEIWHAKGRKAFSDAIRKQEIPDWNDFFEEEWLKFTIVKFRCSECGYIKEVKTINLSDNDKGLMIDLNDFLALMCMSCGNMIEIDKWKVIK